MKVTEELDIKQDGQWLLIEEANAEHTFGLSDNYHYHTYEEADFTLLEIVSKDYYGIHALIKCNLCQIMNVCHFEWIGCESK